MYYEARTVLTTHPNCEYNDGIINIFLYANGQLNIPEGRGKKLQQLLQYMLTGQKPSVTDQEIETIDKLVTKVKAKKEVTTNYMKQWDRDRIIARDAALEARQKAAINLISFSIKNGVSLEQIVDNLKYEYKFDDATIKDLFEKAKVPMTWVTTWEEVKMITKDNPSMNPTAESIYMANADINILEQCRAREDAIAHEKYQKELIENLNATIADQEATIAELRKLLQEHGISEP